MKIAALEKVMHVVLKPGDPMAYVFLAFVVSVLASVAVAVGGGCEIAVGGFTLGQGLLAVTLWLAVGLILLAFVRLFRQPPGIN